MKDSTLPLWLSLHSWLLEEFASVQRAVLSTSICQNMNLSSAFNVKKFTNISRYYSTVLKTTKGTYSNVGAKPEDPNKTRLKVDYENEAGKASKTFTSTWLVHNCSCPNCKQEFTGQKLIDVSKLRPFYTLKDVRSDDHQLRLTWQEREAHETVIHLKDILPSKEIVGPDGPRQFIRSGGSIPKLNYASVFQDEGYRLLRLLNEYGVCLVTNTPRDETSLRNVATKCAPIQRTIYGEFFEVVTSEQATNIAYTDAALHPHMDLAYYESPPGLQFLHCLEFDLPDLVEGGESVIIDAWKSALLFRELHPGHFHSLSKIPASFQMIQTRRDEPVHMVYKRPHIVLDSKDKVVGINWSPAFEGPLDAVNPETAEKYYRGYVEFAKLVETSPFKIEFKLKPGDVLCFNNRRMLHAKSAVKRKENGRRHLRGCYVNIDEFKSKLELLALKFDLDYKVEQVMNGSYF